MTSTPVNTAPQDKRLSAAAIVLSLLGILAAALGLYQWLELAALRSGGDAPLCSLSATLNCANVWNSPLAHTVQQYTGLPFAGWGLAWGLVLLTAGVMLLRAAPGSPALANWTRAARIIAATGTFTTLLLLAYSVMTGVFCPTCLLFYLLVWLAAYVAWRRLPAVTGAWSQGMRNAAVTGFASFLILLYPGLKTPAGNTEKIAIANNVLPAQGDETLRGFLLSLDPETLRIVSDAREMHRNAPLITRPVETARLSHGPARSPVRLIDWVDIRCPHCKNLDASLREIRNATTGIGWSEESRHFPLDSECNPYMQRSNGSGVSCLAARILICLTGTAAQNTVRTALFDQQESLDRDRVWEIAAPTPSQRATLQSCVDAPATTVRLLEDIEYAMQHKIEGTPLVVLNGRQAPAFPPYIYAFILASGDIDAPAFMRLPPPRPPENQ